MSTCVLLSHVSLCDLCVHHAQQERRPSRSASQLDPARRGVGADIVSLQVFKICSCLKGPHFQDCVLSRVCRCSPFQGRAAILGVVFHKVSCEEDKRLNYSWDSGLDYLTIYRPLPPLAKLCCVT